jgi:hypothetical protein
MAKRSGSPTPSSAAPAAPPIASSHPAIRPAGLRPGGAPAPAPPVLPLRADAG